MGRDSILFAIAADRREMLLLPRIGLEVRHQVVERGDADDRDIIARAYFLHRGHGSTAAFHAVERDRHPAGYSVRGPDQVDRLAHGRAGRDDVVDDQHPAREGSSYHRAAFAVVLGFLAIEAVAHVAA